MHEIICEAIRARRLLIFGYAGLVRVVEPHMLGRTRAEHDVLSAWLRPGYSRTDPNGGWRTFLTTEMVNVQALPEQFAGARAGFNASDPRLVTIYCRLDPVSVAGAAEAAPQASVTTDFSDRSPLP